MTQNVVTAGCIRRLCIRSELHDHRVPGHRPRTQAECSVCRHRSLHTTMLEYSEYSRLRSLLSIGPHHWSQFDWLGLRYRRKIQRQKLRPHSGATVYVLHSYFYAALTSMIDVQERPCAVTRDNTRIPLVVLVDFWAESVDTTLPQSLLSARPPRLVLDSRR